jgi:probable rRNA maturation factor
MINITIAEPFTNLIDEDDLINAAQAVLDRHASENGLELTVAIETDEELQELNLQFMEIDTPTDVLSFPSDEIDPDSNLRYIGDVVISYQRASQQAAEAGESVKDEIQLLVVHGTLHLLGFDHSEPSDKDEMWQAQRDILKTIGCPIIHFPE